MTEVVINNTEKKSQEVTYKIGDWFMDDESKIIYVLTKLEGHSAVLISIFGNRYSEAVDVNHYSQLTQEDFLNVSCGDSFTKLSKVTITVE